jgi:hypothetical protein
VADYELTVTLDGAGAGLALVAENVPP